MPQRGGCQLSHYHTETHTHTTYTHTLTLRLCLALPPPAFLFLVWFLSASFSNHSLVLSCAQQTYAWFTHTYTLAHTCSPSPQVSVGRGCHICAGIQFLPLGENCDNSHLHFSFCFSFPFFPLIDSAVCICEGKGTSFMKWSHFMSLCFVITQPQVELSWG